MAPRKRLVAVLLLGLSAVLIFQYVRHWAELSPTLVRSSDFAGSYAAATFWRDGHPSQVYDSSAMQRELASQGVPPGPDHQRFENPPSALWLAVPTTLLSPDSAYRVWSLLQMVLAVGALAIAVRAAPWPSQGSQPIRSLTVVVLMATLPAALLFNEAQWDGFSMIGLALAYAFWRRGLGAPGGFALGLLGTIAKPHLLFGVVAYLVGRRDWRTLAGVATGCGVSVVAALGAVGPEGLARYVRFVTSGSLSPSADMLSLTGLTASWLGTGGMVSVLTYTGELVLLAAAVLVGARSRVEPGSLEAGLFVAVALSLVISPHLLTHDLLFLAPVSICLFARLGSLEGERWPGWLSASLLGAWVALDAAAQVDNGHASATPPGRLVPIALLLMAALGWLMRIPGTRAPAGRASPQSGRALAVSSPAGD